MDLLRVFLGRAEPAVLDVADRPMGSGFATNFPTYEEMMMQTDWDGVARSYLASEENFRTLKGLQERNLIVPIVGNFAGPKALRAVGRYVREHGATIAARITSPTSSNTCSGRAVRRVRTERRDAADRRLQHLHPIRLQAIRLLGLVSLDRRPRQRAGSDPRRSCATSRLAASGPITTSTQDPDKGARCHGLGASAVWRSACASCQPRGERTRA